MRSVVEHKWGKKLVSWICLISFVSSTVIIPGQAQAATTLPPKTSSIFSSVQETVSKIAKYMDSSSNSSACLDSLSVERGNLSSYQAAMTRLVTWSRNAATSPELSAEDQQTISCLPSFFAAMEVDFYQAYEKQCAFEQAQGLDIGIGEASTSIVLKHDFLQCQPVDRFINRIEPLTQRFFQIYQQIASKFSIESLHTQGLEQIDTSLTIDLLPPSKSTIPLAPASRAPLSIQIASFSLNDYIHKSAAIWTHYSLLSMVTKQIYQQHTPISKIFAWASHRYTAGGAGALQDISRLFGSLQGAKIPWMKDYPHLIDRNWMIQHRGYESLIEKPIDAHAAQQPLLEISYWDLAQNIHTLIQNLIDQRWVYRNEKNQAIMVTDQQVPLLPVIQNIAPMICGSCQQRIVDEVGQPTTMGPWLRSTITRLVQQAQLPSFAQILIFKNNQALEQSRAFAKAAGSFNRVCSDIRSKTQEISDTYTVEHKEELGMESMGFGDDGSYFFTKPNVNGAAEQHVRSLGKSALGHEIWDRFGQTWSQLTATRIGSLAIQSATLGEKLNLKSASSNFNDCIQGRGLIGSYTSQDLVQARHLAQGQLMLNVREALQRHLRYQSPIQEPQDEFQDLITHHMPAVLWYLMENPSIQVTSMILQGFRQQQIDVSWRHLFLVTLPTFILTYAQNVTMIGGLGGLSSRAFYSLLGGIGLLDAAQTLAHHHQAKNEHLQLRKSLTSYGNVQSQWMQALLNGAQSSQETMQQTWTRLTLNALFTGMVAMMGPRPRNAQKDLARTSTDLTEGGMTPRTYNQTTRLMDQRAIPRVPKFNKVDAMVKRSLRDPVQIPTVESPFQGGQSPIKNLKVDRPPNWNGGPTNKPAAPTPRAPSGSQGSGPTQTLTRTRTTPQTKNGGLSFREITQRLEAKTPSQLREPTNAIRNLRNLEAQATTETQRVLNPMLIFNTGLRQLGQEVQQNIDLAPIRTTGDPSIIDRQNKVDESDNFLKQIFIEEEAAQAVRGTAMLKAEHISIICGWARDGGVWGSKAAEFAAKHGIDCRAVHKDDKHKLDNLTISENAFPRSDSFTLGDVLRKVTAIHSLIITQQDKENYKWLVDHARTIAAALRKFPSKVAKKDITRAKFLVTYIDMHLISIFSKQGDRALAGYFGRNLSFEEARLIVAHPNVDDQDSYKMYYQMFGNNPDRAMPWLPPYRFDPAGRYGVFSDFVDLGENQDQRWYEFTRTHPTRLNSEETKVEVITYNAEMEKGGVDLNFLLKSLAHLPRKKIKEIYAQLVENPKFRLIRSQEGFYRIREIYGIHRGWGDIPWNQMGMSAMAAIQNVTKQTDIYDLSHRFGYNVSLATEMDELIAQTLEPGIAEEAADFVKHLTGRPERSYRKFVNIIGKNNPILNHINNAMYIVRLQNNQAMRREEVTGRSQFGQYIKNTAIFRQLLIRTLRMEFDLANELTLHLANHGVLENFIQLQFLDPQYQSALAVNDLNNRIEKLKREAVKKVTEMRAGQHFRLPTEARETDTEAIKEQRKEAVKQRKFLESVMTRLGFHDGVIPPKEFLQVLLYIHEMKDGFEKNRIIHSVLPGYYLRVTANKKLTLEQSEGMALQMASDDVHMLGERKKSAVPKELREEVAEIKQKLENLKSLSDFDKAKLMIVGELEFDPSLMLSIKWVLSGKFGKHWRHAAYEWISAIEPNYANWKWNRLYSYIELVSMKEHHDRVRETTHDAQLLLDELMKINILSVVTSIKKKVAAGNLSIKDKAKALVLRLMSVDNSMSQDLLNIIGEIQAMAKRTDVMGTAARIWMLRHLKDGEIDDETFMSEEYQKIFYNDHLRSKFKNTPDDHWKKRIKPVDREFTKRIVMYLDEYNAKYLDEFIQILSGFDGPDWQKGAYIWLSANKDKKNTADYKLLQRIYTFYEGIKDLDISSSEKQSRFNQLKDLVIESSRPRTKATPASNGHAAAVGALMDFRQEAKRILAEAKKNEQVNMLIWDKYLQKVDGYYSKLKAIQKMMPIQWSKEQNKEFYNLLAYVQALPTEGDRFTVMHSTAFKYILSSQYQVPKLSSQPNNVHDVVERIISPLVGVVNVDQGISVSKPFDPAEMINNAVLVERLYYMKDHGVFAIRQDQETLDKVLYVHWYGTRFDRTGDLTKRADVILGSAYIFDQESEAIQNILDKDRSVIQKAKAIVLGSKKYNSKWLDPLISLLAGEEGFVWQAYAVDWFDVNRNKSKAYDFYVLDVIFKSYLSINSWPYGSKKAHDLLNDCYRSYEKKVMSLIHAFYNQNQGASQIKIVAKLPAFFKQSVEELSKHMDENANPLSLKFAKAYFKSFRHLHLDELELFIELADKHPELYITGMVVHLMNAIDPNQYHVKVRLLAFVKIIDKVTGRTSHRTTQNWVSAMSGPGVSILGRETVNLEQAEDEGDDVLNAALKFFRELDESKEIAYQTFLMDLEALIDREIPQDWLNEFKIDAYQITLINLKSDDDHQDIMLHLQKLTDKLHEEFMDKIDAYQAKQLVMRLANAQIMGVYRSSPLEDLSYLDTRINFAMISGLPITDEKFLRRIHQIAKMSVHKYHDEALRWIEIHEPKEVAVDRYPNLHAIAKKVLTQPYVYSYAVAHAHLIQFGLWNYWLTELDLPTEIQHQFTVFAYTHHKIPNEEKERKKESGAALILWLSEQIADHPLASKAVHALMDAGILGEPIAIPTLDELYAKTSLVRHDLSGLGNRTIYRELLGILSDINALVTKPIINGSTVESKELRFEKMSVDVRMINLLMYSGGPEKLVQYFGRELTTEEKLLTEQDPHIFDSKTWSRWYKVVGKLRDWPAHPAVSSTDRSTPFFKLAKTDVERWKILSGFRFLSFVETKNQIKKYRIALKEKKLSDFFNSEYLYEMTKAGLVDVNSSITFEQMRKFFGQRMGWMPGYEINKNVDFVGWQDFVGEAARAYAHTGNIDPEDRHLKLLLDAQAVKAMQDRGSGPSYREALMEYFFGDTANSLKNDFAIDGQVIDQVAVFEKFMEEIKFDDLNKDHQWEILEILYFIHKFVVTGTTDKKRKLIDLGDYLSRKLKISQAAAKILVDALAKAYILGERAKQKLDPKLEIKAEEAVTRQFGIAAYARDEQPGILQWIEVFYFGEGHFHDKAKAWYNRFMKGVFPKREEAQEIKLARQILRGEVKTDRFSPILRSAMEVISNTDGDANQADARTWLNEQRAITRDLFTFRLPSELRNIVEPVTNEPKITGNIESEQPPIREAHASLVVGKTDPVLRVMRNKEPAVPAVSMENVSVEELDRRLANDLEQAQELYSIGEARRYFDSDLRTQFYEVDGVRRTKSDLWLRFRRSINYYSYFNQQDSVYFLFYYYHKKTQQDCTTGTCMISLEDEQTAAHFLKKKFRLSDEKATKWPRRLADAGILGETHNGRLGSATILYEAKRAINHPFPLESFPKEQQASILAQIEQFYLKHRNEYDRAKEWYIRFRNSDFPSSENLEPRTQAQIAKNKKILPSDLSFLTEFPLKTSAKLQRLIDLSRQKYGLADVGNLLVIDFTLGQRDKNTIIKDFIRFTHYNNLRDDRKNELKLLFYTGYQIVQEYPKYYDVIFQVLQFYLSNRNVVAEHIAIEQIKRLYLVFSGQDAEIEKILHPYDSIVTVVDPDAEIKDVLLGNKAFTYEHFIRIRELSFKDDDLGILSRKWLIHYLLDSILQEANRDKIKNQSLLAFLEATLKNDQYLLALLMESAGLKKEEISDWYVHIEPYLSVWKDLLSKLKLDPVLDKWKVNLLASLCTHIHLIPNADTRNKKLAMKAMRNLLKIMGYDDPSGEESIVIQMGKLQMLGGESVPDHIRWMNKVHMGPKGIEAINHLMKPEQFPFSYELVPYFMEIRGYDTVPYSSIAFDWFAQHTVIEAEILRAIKVMQGDTSIKVSSKDKFWISLFAKLDSPRGVMAREWLEKDAPATADSKTERFIRNINSILRIQNTVSKQVALEDFLGARFTESEMEIINKYQTSNNTVYKMLHPKASQKHELRGASAFSSELRWPITKEWNGKHSSLVSELINESQKIIWNDLNTVVFPQLDFHFAAIPLFANEPITQELLRLMLYIRKLNQEEWAKDKPNAMLPATRGKALEDFLVNHVGILRPMATQIIRSINVSNSLFIQKPSSEPINSSFQPSRIQNLGLILSKGQEQVIHQVLSQNLTFTQILNLPQMLSENSIHYREWILNGEKYRIITNEDQAGHIESHRNIVDILYAMYVSNQILLHRHPSAVFLSIDGKKVLIEKNPETLKFDLNIGNFTHGNLSLRKLRDKALDLIRRDDHRSDGEDWVLKFNSVLDFALPNEIFLFAMLTGSTNLSPYAGNLEFVDCTQNKMDVSMHDFPITVMDSVCNIQVGLDHRSLMFKISDMISVHPARMDMFLRSFGLVRGKEVEDRTLLFKEIILESGSFMSQLKYWNEARIQRDIGPYLTADQMKVLLLNRMALLNLEKEAKLHESVKERILNTLRRSTDHQKKSFVINARKVTIATTEDSLTIEEINPSDPHQKFVFDLKEINDDLNSIVKLNMQLSQKNRDKTSTAKLMNSNMMYEIAFVYLREILGIQVVSFQEVWASKNDNHRSFFGILPKVKDANVAASEVPVSRVYTNQGYAVHHVEYALNDRLNSPVTVVYTLQQYHNLVSFFTEPPQAEEPEDQSVAILMDDSTLAGTVTTSLIQIPTDDHINLALAFDADNPQNLNEEQVIALMIKKNIRSSEFVLYEDDFKASVINKMYEIYLDHKHELNDSLVDWLKAHSEHNDRRHPGITVILNDFYLQLEVFALRLLDSKENLLEESQREIVSMRLLAVMEPGSPEILQRAQEWVAWRDGQSNPSEKSSPTTPRLPLMGDPSSTGQQASQTASDEPGEHSEGDIATATVAKVIDPIIRMDHLFPSATASTDHGPNPAHLYEEEAYRGGNVGFRNVPRMVLEILKVMIPRPRWFRPRSLPPTNAEGSEENSFALNKWLIEAATKYLADPKQKELKKQFIELGDRTVSITFRSKNIEVEETVHGLDASPFTFLFAFKPTAGGSIFIDGTSFGLFRKVNGEIIRSQYLRGKVLMNFMFHYFEVMKKTRIDFISTVWKKNDVPELSRMYDEFMAKLEGKKTPTDAEKNEATNSTWSGKLYNEHGFHAIRAKISYDKTAVVVVFEKTFDGSEKMISGHSINLALLDTQYYPGLKNILNDSETMGSLIRYFGRTTWTDEEIFERHEKFRDEHTRGTGISWVVLSKQGKVVGNCGLKNIDQEKSEAEFGIILDKSVWGTSVVTESHMLSLKYAFEKLGLKRVTFITDKDNQRMKGYFEKIGVSLVGETEDHYLQYEVQSSEWPAFQVRAQMLLGA
jgi:RimJ/RimL family protein N-acetyltransferase